MPAARFTAWLAEGERSSLRHLAARLGCSENYLVRIALRAMLLGEPVPAYVLADIDKACNDSNGGNGENEITGTSR